MQVINYYKDIFQENIKLIVSFLNSAEKAKLTVIEKRYGKIKKESRTS